MRKTIYRGLFAIFAFVLALASVAHAQNPSHVDIAIANTGKDWEDAEQLTAAKSKLYVVTTDQPDRKQSCRVQSITDDELICSRAHGGPQTYKREQIAALILPGTKGETLALFLGLNAGLGASIWGTVALVATCPACAAGIAFLALYLVVGEPFVLGDYEAERLLYLAPGQQLTGRLRSIAR